MSQLWQIRALEQGVSQKDEKKQVPLSWISGFSGFQAQESIQKSRQRQTKVSERGDYFQTRQSKKDKP